MLSPVVLLACALPAYLCGDFVPPYALGSFTLTNSAFANGTVDGAGAPQFIVLTGPNDGSDLAGSTELTTVSHGTGSLHFKYSYSSLDIPGLDAGGYVVNGHFVQLASADGQSGVVDVPIHSGDTFGFRIESVDNTGEPGVLTISDFSAPGATSVPTTSLPAEMALAALLSLLSFRLIRRGVSG